MLKTKLRREGSWEEFDRYELEGGKFPEPDSSRFGIPLYFMGPITNERCVAHLLKSGYVYLGPAEWYDCDKYIKYPFHYYLYRVLEFLYNLRWYPKRISRYFNGY